MIKKKFKFITIFFCILISSKITTNAINKNIVPSQVVSNINVDEQQENENIPNESITTILNEYENFNEIEEQQFLEEEEEMLREPSLLQEEIEEENEEESEEDEETKKYYEEKMEILKKDIEKIIEEE